MVAAFKANINVEEDNADSDGDTNEIENNIQESQDLFQLQDQDDEEDRFVTMLESASSDVANFDMCEKDHQDSFVGWKRSSCFVHTLQLVVKVFETAPAYNRTVKSGKK
jgi:hypothetical protein